MIRCAVTSTLQPSLRRRERRSPAPRPPTKFCRLRRRILTPSDRLSGIAIDAVARIALALNLFQILQLIALDRGTIVLKRLYVGGLTRIAAIRRITLRLLTPGFERHGFDVVIERS